MSKVKKTLKSTEDLLEEEETEDPAEKFAVNCTVAGIKRPRFCQII